MAAMLVQRIVVHGRVQGVGFRDFVVYVALRKDLEGWVRNRSDNSVEAVFSGTGEAVAAAIAACRRGPPSAHVDSVETLPASVGDLDLRRPGERFSRLATL
jgi:acylphosphatase